MELQQASNIATQLVEYLRPHCDRIQVAGSIRRESPFVNDIEIVCQPKGQPQEDLFGFVTGQIRSKEFIQALTAIGEKVKGQPADGRYCRFKVNGTPLEVDVFMPEPADYFRQLTIRTGSRDFVKNFIAGGWKKKGWCGTPDGLRLMRECTGRPNASGGTDWTCNVKNPTLPPVWENEEAFFTWLGMLFVKPKYR